MKIPQPHHLEDCRSHYLAEGWRRRHQNCDWCRRWGQGGFSISLKKVAAARANGKKGGRPKSVFAGGIGFVTKPNGRPRRYATNAERQASYRQRKVAAVIGRALCSSSNTHEI